MKYQKYITNDSLFYDNFYILTTNIIAWEYPLKAY
ncbi:Uncharacterised protein [uncultured archaeon]|nr:Uncharacterised protein [uncultured archaeon]